MTLVDLLQRPRYEVFPVEGVADEVAQHVPTEIKVTVTSSPRRGIDRTLELVEELARRGFQAVPHISARLVADEDHLERILQRLREARVREVFVIAGDVDRPVGKFTRTSELLDAMAGLEHGLEEIGISGYPESHPFISDEETIQAMFDKAPFATYIVSQICFEPAVIAWWIGAVRDRGVALPIYVGIPGHTSRARLLRISRKVGVGESVRFLRHHGNVFTRLFVSKSYSPGQLIDGLAAHVLDPQSKVAGFHVYTFNELAATERWRRELLARLA